MYCPVCVQVSWASNIYPCPFNRDLGACLSSERLAFSRERVVFSRERLCVLFIPDRDHIILRCCLKKLSFENILYVYVVDGLWGFADLRQARNTIVGQLSSTESRNDGMRNNNSSLLSIPCEQWQNIEYEVHTNIEYEVHDTFRIIYICSRRPCIILYLKNASNYGRFRLLSP